MSHSDNPTYETPHGTIRISCECKTCKEAREGKVADKPPTVHEIEQIIVQRIKEDQRAGFADFTIRSGMIRHVEGLCDIGLLTDPEDVSGVMQIVYEYTNAKYTSTECYRCGMDLDNPDPCTAPGCSQ